MLNQYKTKRDENVTIPASQRGFTIIEVMIVLAIAGLIMLIVFLAVPALQRSSRNTSRKNDVTALLSAYTDAVNNNGGQVPATCTGGAAGCWINETKLGYYQPANVVFTNNSSTATAIDDPASGDKVFIETNSKCDGQTSTADNATARSVAAVYDIETSSGLAEQCIES